MKRTTIFIAMLLLITLIAVGCGKEVEPIDTDGSLMASISEEDELANFKMTLGENAKISKEDIENMYQTDKNMLLYFDTFSGRPAPDFEMEGLDGKKVNLSDFKGENVIVEFMGSWCDVCINSIPNNKEFNEKYDNAKIISIGIDETIDNLKEVAKETGSENVEYYLPTSKSTAEEYDVFFVPIYFYIDSEGYIQMILAGDAPVELLMEYADKSFD